MTVKVDPVGLIQLGGVLLDILRVEVIMRGGELGGIVDNWLLIGGLSRKGVFGGFYFVDVSVLLLLFRADLSIVVLELLGRSESWQEGEVRCHIFITY